MSWVGAAIGGASLLSGLIGSNASEEAAQQQARAAQNALNLQTGEFNTITAQENPFVQSGYGSLSQLNYLLGIGTPGTAPSPSAGMLHPGSSAIGTPGTASSSTAGGYGSLITPFTAQTMQQYSPAYQFQMQQGQQGVLNTDAAGQGALSGAALKDLTSYNQNYSNTAFGNAFNQYQTQQQNTYARLAGLTQLGQTAAANTGAAGVNLANSAGQSAQNIGTALAGGTVGSANAWTGALNNAGSLASLYGSPSSTLVPDYSPTAATIDGGTLDAGGGYTFNT